MEYPTLYTLNANGIRYWKVKVTNDGQVCIIREYGKYQGKPIVNCKVITECKSRKTVLEQAEFEAKGYWTEMVNKKGYVEQLPNQSSTPVQVAVSPVAVVQTGQVLSTSANGFKFLPMLANKFSERKQYVHYPCIAQPKLDGVRYTANMTADGTVVLKTRNDAICPFFDHIKNDIKLLHPSPDVYLDGEFYSASVPFKTLNGYCNRKKLEGYNNIPKEAINTIKYNIFDCYFTSDPKKPFSQRYEYLTSLFAQHHDLNYLVLVQIQTVNTESEIMPMHNAYVSDGYEGIIIRNADSPYKLKDRSNDLLKYKNFIDSEFIIAGASAPTNGKEENCIIWELKLPNSDLTFTCRPRESYDSRKQEWQQFQAHPAQYIGQKYTVRYQETYDNGIPRFPVGVAIRCDV